MSNKYTPIIGLEVHVELKTKSKMFCACSADYFGKEPNTHTCPVCLGLPGALPVPNKTAIAWCIKIALALNCEIAEFSKFDRKNYFYPDLPKGYQISQYDLPFGHKGSITVSTGKVIRIRRVHMEEDTGKLRHQTLNGENVSMIDFNRSSVPLVEIVTEPNFSSATEVKEYLQRLQQIVRDLDVSNADMEKGDMRLEPNISLQATSNKPQEDKNVSRVTGHMLPSYKVEVKNINSFSFVEKAINYEIKRQSEILESGKTPAQETRGWNENKGITFSQRVKEEANDYRYFPDPDIPPIRHAKQQIDQLKKELPELQEEKIKRLAVEYSIPEYDAEILSRDKATAKLFEDAVEAGKEKNVSPKQIANYIINKKISNNDNSPTSLISLIVSSTATTQIEEAELEKIINQVIKDNPKAVLDFKKGKESVIMFLVGQVMRSAKQKINAELVKSKLLAALK